jgi:hypothetical protein
MEAVVGGVLLVLVLGYVAFYWRGLTGMERYSSGFVVDHCPVCNRGTLTVENRQERLLGIPRARRTVRCSNCRSVLRETGVRRWRYAVDPLENPTLFKLYNGREVDETTLTELAGQPTASVVVRPPSVPPSFVDDDERKS